MGHLNGILARVGGNLDNNFQKSQMPGELPGRGGGILKLRFDRFISPLFCFLFLFYVCLFVFFFSIIQSQAAFVNCLYVARFTIVHSKTQIKFPLLSLLLRISSSSIIIRSSYSLI